MAREMRTRWRRVSRDMTESIVQNDVLYIQRTADQMAERDRVAAERNNLDIANRALPSQSFPFVSDAGRVDLIMSWLERLEETEILGLARRGSQGIGRQWTDPYLERSYTQGVEQAQAHLVRAGYDPRAIASLPGSTSAAQALLTPAHVERLEILFARTFEDLKTVQAATNSLIRRSLMDGLSTDIAAGLAAGQNPRVVAREIAKTLESHFVKVGAGRSETIARTEIIRAHHLATIEEYQRVDASMLVEVLAEWGLGANPCPLCEDLANDSPYTLDAIKGMIPAHPRCVCTAIPLVRQRRPATGGGAKGDFKAPKFPPSQIKKPPLRTPRGSGIVPLKDRPSTIVSRPNLKADKFKGTSLQKHIGKDGRLSLERAQLHEAIIKNHFEGVTATTRGEKPVYHMMGGGSASGKGSVVKSGQVKIPKNVVNVDSDEIKKLLPEYREFLRAGKTKEAAAFVHQESSMLGELIIDRAKKGRFNVFLDGTGNSAIERLRGRIMPMRNAGYEVKANYVSIDTAEALARSADRAARTGRLVPEKIIRGTHAGVSRSMPKALDEGLFTKLDLYDNNGKIPILVMSYNNGRQTIHNQSLWRRFLSKVNDDQ